MSETKQKGDVTELACLTEFAKMGYICSIPYGNNARYDILVDTGENILRVQCKSARYIDNKKTSFIIGLKSVNVLKKKTTCRFYDKNQIDVFATYINNTMYIIPVEEAGHSITLRLQKPKNNLKVKIRYAEDYTAQKFFENCDVYLDNERYSIYVLYNYKKNHQCPICGTPVSKEDVLCPTCAKLESRKVEWPSREELKGLIRDNSFCQIGKKFGVSDVMIHKWCKRYGLPYRKRDIKKISDEDWKNV